MVNKETLPLNRLDGPESVSKLQTNYIHFQRKIQVLLSKPQTALSFVEELMP